MFCLLAVVLIVGGDSLLRSYKYYSRIIDARLASGYLTSRPGIYAAPRVIQTGQKLSPTDLIRSLRRAGYVEAQGSNVWSGTFVKTGSAIEIHPQRHGSQPSVVRIAFGEDHRVSEVNGDNMKLERFVLEPEALSNDLSFKIGKRESLSFSEIPPVLVQAILSIEDQRFFEHSGVDPVGIARALLRNVDDERLSQGGSSITQQLVKNTYLSSEKTFRRKYAEGMLSLALERRLSKQDIFALYCNEVYLGQRGASAARGFRDAAQMYLGKPIASLTLSEAALLAGMIQSPARYSPLHHAEAALIRRDTVLQAMTRDGWINEAQLAAAKREPLTVSASVNDSLAPYFVDFVNRDSASQTENSLPNQRIYTTIDLDLQQLAEAALARQLTKLGAPSATSGAKPQAALVALDPHTGNILAMVGGRDYASSQLNRATDARRQPGSTFKPFVYATALEDGMSPVRTFNDGPREFVYDRNKTYRPANFGGAYSMHDVTMRTALVKSLNVVTVDVALQTGLTRIANMAERFGLPRPEKYPALALGTKEVTPLELAAAYASFVNGGRRIEPKAIASLDGPPPTHAAAQPPQANAQVISPTTAYMITNMLSAVVDHGTGRAARDLSKTVAVAGKTGTSRDGWFVGYTPNLVCVVWIGFDDNEQLGRTGADAALPAWVDFIKNAVELKPELGGRNFECPEGIKFVEIDADAGSLSTLSCPHRELIAVTERLAPNVECFQHGNLPRLFESAEGYESSNGAMAIAHHREVIKPKKLIMSIPSKFGSTQVQVDRWGKRTLVNDLR
ncbi:MAG TPA: PBP1A family penicillin-binding protein [Pyrinomonadaceae bacterium]|nr:PBP1A family penicillin-binding protein [Pyrinomonadaceae bacterium]